MRLDLDLDRPVIRSAVLEKRDSGDLLMSIPPEMNLTNGSRSIFWISVFLRWALDQGSTAIHLMRDEQDQVLRQLVYVLMPQARWTWFEALPLGWRPGNQWYDSLRCLIGLVGPESTAEVEVKYQDTTLRAECILQSRNDLVMFLGKERLSIRTKPS